MVEGRINKFYKDVVVTEQEFVKDPDMTVAQLVEKVGNACGASDLKFVRFARLERGEGIDGSQAYYERAYPLQLYTPYMASDGEGAPSRGDKMDGTMSCENYRTNYDRVQHQTY
jgi:hypothetical protein